MKAYGTSHVIIYGYYGFQICRSIIDTLDFKLSDNINIATILTVKKIIIQKESCICLPILCPEGRKYGIELRSVEIGRTVTKKC